MKRIQQLCASCLVFCFLCSSGAMGEESLESLVTQGNVFDEKFQPAEALKFYLPAEKLEPKNVNVLLRIARQYRHLMQDANDTGEKLRLGGVAKDYAARAVALAPNDAEAHLSVAISHAKMTPILSNKEKMESSRLIKSAVDKALSIDSKQDRGWHLLGCWHQRLADIGAVKRAIAAMVYGGLPEATNEEAVKCFERAIEINPDDLKHYIELGRTYAQMGKPVEGRLFIEKGLGMPDVGKDDPELKRLGRETLAELQ